jgi:hypothetical protein
MNLIPEEHMLDASCSRVKSSTFTEDWTEADHFMDMLPDHIVGVTHINV